MKRIAFIITMCIISLMGYCGNGAYHINEDNFAKRMGDMGLNTKDGGLTYTSNATDYDITISLFRNGFGDGVEEIVISIIGDNEGNVQYLCNSYYSIIRCFGFVISGKHITIDSDSSAWGNGGCRYSATMTLVPSCNSGCGLRMF